MTDHPQKAATHAAWAPVFDRQGNFVKSVNIGQVFIEMDSDGKASGFMMQHTHPLGYESCYIYFAPLGQEPPAPPPEIIEAARFEAEQRKQLDLASAPAVVS
jgi:hypothetical protein